MKDSRTAPTRQRAHASAPLTAGLPLTSAALDFARERHRDAIEHPLDVAAELRRAGCPDEVVASGLLHEVLEATDTDAAQLEARFGGGVARLVEAVSEDASIEDEEDRKAALRAQVARAPRDAALVFAADKLSRVRALPARVERGLSPDAARRKLDHYSASLVMLQGRLGGSHPFVARLRFELEQLERA